MRNGLIRKIDNKGENMSDNNKISYQNYDFTLKNALEIFQDKTLDFLDETLPKIRTSLKTEYKEIMTKTDIMDLNFLLEDGTILQLEEEANISKEDMVRFAYYNLILYKTYKSKVKTIILTVDKNQKEDVSIDSGSVKFNPKIINIGKKDGDKRLKEIKKMIMENRPINEIELVFLPIMDTCKKRIDFLKEIVMLEKELPYSAREKEKLIAMTLVAGNKFVEKEEISNIWEEIKMLTFMEYAEEKGLEKGLEEGLEKGVEKGITKTLIKLLIKKFGVVPDKYREELKKSKEDVLEVIADEILDIKDLRELDKYFEKRD